MYMLLTPALRGKTSGSQNSELQKYLMSSFGSCKHTNRHMLPQSCAKPYVQQTQTKKKTKVETTEEGIYHGLFSGCYTWMDRWTDT